MKFEKRNVMIKELWTMSYKERLFFEVANTLCNLDVPEINPLKMSIKSIAQWVLFLLIMITWVISAPYLAHKLKTRKMPQSSDPLFKDSDEWFLEDRWVIKN